LGHPLSMTQLVIGTALGFLGAQALLYGLKQLSRRMAGKAQSPAARPGEPLPASAFMRAFVRYAPTVALSVALITLAAWAVKDHLAARRAGNVAVADSLDAAGAAQLADSRAGVDDVAVLTQPGGGSSPAAAPAAAPPDPYSDPDFRRPPRPHRAGAPSLKDALLQRSEAKARAELLSDLRQQRNHSQYDCEAAARAERYLKAGLDVWGFADWEAKYFPVDTYKGATLPECRDIKNVVEPSRLNLQSAVARGSQP
jgi:hypothetical protein